MELFEASVRIVKPGLRRVEGQEKSPGEQAREDFEDVAKVQKKLEEVVRTILIKNPRCVPYSPNCCPEDSGKIRATIVRMLEKHEYKADQHLDYLHELINNPELMTSLLNEPV
jgi:hypothetical protein